MRSLKNQIKPVEFYFNLTNKEAKILETINDDQLTINDIMNRIGYSYSSLMGHIRELKSEGILSSVKSGRHYYYSISNPLVHALIT